MVGIVFAALAIAWMLALTVAVVFQLVALTRAWFEMPATCSWAADKTATIRKRNARRPSEGGTAAPLSLAWVAFSHLQFSQIRARFRAISLFNVLTRLQPGATNGQ